MRVDAERDGLDEARTQSVDLEQCPSAVNAQTSRGATATPLIRRRRSAKT
jgi:hypothetical protein